MGTPEAWLASNSFRKAPTMRLNTNIQFEYKPISNLTLTAIGAYNYTDSRESNFKATLPVNINNNIKNLGPSILSGSAEYTAYKSFQGTANYANKINETHFLDILVGYSWEDQTYRNISAGRDNFPSNDYPYLTAGSPDNQTNSGGGNDWVIQSFFGRAQYNYDQRYLAEVTMRYDGSSRFPKTERYGFFPSVATGWRLSEESFIRENVNLGFINNLKLKASVGILGNNNIGNYAYQSVYNLGNNYNYPFGGTLSQGAAMTTYTDPNLKWETTQTVDGGFESILWDGLLSFNASYFLRYSYDILYKPNSSVSSIFGLDLNEVNTGELVNKGWEFEIGHKNQIGKFSYGINGNFSIINNKVESLGVGDVEQANGLIGNGSSMFIGYPLQMYYGYVTDGVFLDQSDIDSWFAHTNQSAMGAPQAKTKSGDIRYVDISGPDGVPDGKVDATYDRVYLGSRIPKYTYGININTEYKGFDLTLFFQGVAGVKGMLSHYSGWALWSEGSIQKWQMDRAFDAENPTRYPSYPRISNLGNAIGINTQTSDFWVRDASYLRLKTAQFGYTIPKRIMDNTAISSVRFYFSGENLYTWDSYPPGWDPETNSSGSYYPFLKNFTFGVNVKF
ncbi:MAG: SusC/RagA family TonB-linked outer membrane protein [Bacteroidales bacterium]